MGYPSSIFKAEPNEWFLRIITGLIKARLHVLYHTWFSLYCCNTMIPNQSKSIQEVNEFQLLRHAYIIVSETLQKLVVTTMNGVRILVSIY